MLFIIIKSMFSPIAAGVFAMPARGSWNFSCRESGLKMLGRFVRVKVHKPMGSVDDKYGFRYKVNYGQVEGTRDAQGKPQEAYILGINHSVREFEGRVIAAVHGKGPKEVRWVVAPKSRRYIINDIRPAINFGRDADGHKIDCLYEKSCGAVIFRTVNSEVQYLLIKNKRSENWGFPKGHIEAGETERETAIREVLEETGLHIDILPDFTAKSEYSIQGRVEKFVTIFLASTKDTVLRIQEDEIDDYAWADYANALRILKFDNDRSIMRQANKFLKRRAYI